MINDEIVNKVNNLAADEVPTSMIIKHLRKLGWSRQDIKDSYDKAQPDARKELRFDRVKGALKLVLFLLVCTAIIYYGGYALIARFPNLGQTLRSWADFVLNAVGSVIK